MRRHDESIGAIENIAGWEATSGQIGRDSRTRGTVNHPAYRDPHEETPSSGQSVRRSGTGCRKLDGTAGGGLNHEEFRIPCRVHTASWPMAVFL